MLRKIIIPILAIAFLFNAAKPLLGHFNSDFKKFVEATAKDRLTPKELTENTKEYSDESQDEEFVDYNSRQILALSHISVLKKIAKTIQPQNFLFRFYLLHPIRFSYLRIRYLSAIFLASISLLFLVYFAGCLEGFFRVIIFLRIYENFFTASA